jgi:hypothetical protein
MIRLNEATTAKLEELVAALNAEQAADFARKGFTFEPDRWQVKKIAAKFTYIDCGGSGAFLMENTTGELFNIMGYGKPDYNKKAKADIGNLFTVDPARLFQLRWNYLR